MVQVATPSRERVEHYQAAGEGRARGRPDQRRVRPGRRAGGALPAPVVQPQRAGRAVLRGRRHDGDPAARRHEPGGQGVRRRRAPTCGGALVLSEFAGAAAELRQAFLCNPHDLDGVKDALHARRRRRPRRGRAAGCASCSGTCAPTTSPHGPRTFLHRAGATARCGRPTRSGRMPGTSDRSTPPTRRRPRRVSCAPRSAGSPACPQLLVACDYDGTLAPIVEDPSQAVPLPEAVAAIRALAALPQTTVAVVSGRALRDLAALSRLPSEVHLVGSHGSEFDVGFVERLAPELVDVRTRLGRRAARDRRRRTRACGWRQAGQRRRAHPRAPTARSPPSVLEAVRAGPATLAGRARHRRARRSSSCRWSPPTRAPRSTSCAPSSRPARCSSSATTSPTRTRSPTCTGPDVGIKIGARRDPGATTGSPTRWTPPGCSACCWRPGAPGSSASAPCRSSGTRCWPTAAPSPCSPRTAKVTWLCHPRPDSSAIFADLLGGAPAGHFTVAPDRGRRACRWASATGPAR